MGKKVGFIHIVEIIIISIVVFILVMQFAVIPTIQSDWTASKLSLQGNDILFSLDSAGINWLDKGEVAEKVGKVLEGTGLSYSVELANVAKPEISVGCFCSEQETSKVRELLNDGNVSFSINGQNTRFIVSWLEPSNNFFPVFYDVIVIGEDAFGRYAFDPERSSTKAGIESYIRGDRGLVLYSNLVPERLTPTISDLFGLAWNDMADPTGSIRFAVDKDSRYYNIRKYFAHIPNSTGDGFFPEDQQFQNFLAEERINSSGGSVHIMETSGGAAALVAKEYAFRGTGRTAWFSRGLLEREQEAVLFKSLISWAAGNTYEILPGDVSEPRSFSIHKVVHQGLNPMYQPIEVILRLGYVF